MIEEMKMQIDLVSVVQNSGVELTQRGGRHVGLCPFHSEKTASFTVFPDQRFKCFGCQVGGDVIDFTMRYFNLSFPDALTHLGIKKRKGTPVIRRDIQKRKRKAEAVKKFRQWEILYCIYISDLFFKTKKLMMQGIPPEDLDFYAMLFHQLPVWENHINILVHGNDEVKFELYKDKETHGKFRFRNAACKFSA